MSASAHYEVAIVTHLSGELKALPALVSWLRDELKERAPQGITLYGHRSGEVVVLLKFPLTAYSSALRGRLDRKAAEQLRGKLVELGIGENAERSRFLEHLRTYPVRVDVDGRLEDALGALRASLGVSEASSQPVYHLYFETVDDICAVYARFLAEGSVFIPTPRPVPAGTAVRLLFVASGLEPMPTDGEALETPSDQQGRGFRATLSPTQSWKELLVRLTHQRRAGRQTGTDSGARRHARFDTCLQVTFDNFPDLSIEYASNISKGGLFVRTATPPPLRARVQLTVGLPSGQEAITEVEVVRVVTAAEAAERSTLPGVGLAFLTQDPAFHGAISSLLADYESRQPRVLVVEAEQTAREALCAALRAAGMEVYAASSGEEALRTLVDELFGLDLMLLDMDLPDLAGAQLLGRIRQLGGELDLRIVALASGDDKALARWRGPQGANDVLPRETPPSQVVDRVLAVLGRRRQAAPAGRQP